MVTTKEDWNRVKTHDWHDLTPELFQCATCTLIMHTEEPVENIVGCPGRPGHPSIEKMNRKYIK